MIDIFGYVGSLIVFISFMMKDIKKLRLINAVACIIFVIYGIVKVAYPVAITNIIVVIINIVFLIRNK